MKQQVEDVGRVHVSAEREERNAQVRTDAKSYLKRAADEARGGAALRGGGNAKPADTLSVFKRALTKAKAGY